MSERVTMPALGESVTEGTVTRWLKSVGDAVEVDEPLLEVSTDKVDTEIPSPVAGTLQEILVEEDETVEVGADLAVIGDGDASEGSDDSGQQQDDAEDEPSDDDSTADDSTDEDSTDESAPDEDASDDEPAQESEEEPQSPPSAGTSDNGDGEGETVTMPALGESVTEGTVTRWLKAEGDDVEVDEPLLEVSTDKVDTEIPSPVAGKLTKILVAEDETVEVGADLAVIGGSSGGSGGGEESSSSGEQDTQTEEPQQPTDMDDESDSDNDSADSPTGAEGAEEQDAEQPGGGDDLASEAKVQDEAAEQAKEATSSSGSGGSSSDSGGSERSQQSSSDTGSEQQKSGGDSAPASSGGDVSSYVTPLVRKLAAQHNVDLSAVTGTGVGGRIRKQDVLAAAEAAKQTAAAAPAAPATPATSSAPSSQLPSSIDAKRGSREKMSRLRKVIAKRMVESLQVSAQLTTVVEVDVTKVARLRAKAKGEFEQREGVKLSFMPFFALAAIEALKAHPVVNASVEDEEIVYHAQENLGVAVDTEKGLIVPVIKDAGDLNIAGLARKIADLAERTRTNKVTPDELGGGTFTLTNTGSRGALFDTPILNQPQVGILGTGSVVKRPVVVIDEDGGETIAIRSMVYLALTYDHRIVDGADAARFLGTVKARLEEGSFEV